MPDAKENDPPTGETAELALEDVKPAGALAVAHDDLRDHLPGLEPDRQVSDWGRSERVEAVVDRTLYDFLYHYWFRVEVQGIENVPSTGGALLLANHAGPLPPDAAMIAKAIREEHRHPRPVHFLTERRLNGIPGLGMVMTKVGGVPDHPANLHRLLFDESQLVLVFPEGRAGASKPIKERYRLRRFSRSACIQAAMRAAVPIVPTVVVGAEEATPVLGRLGLLRRAARVPRLPLAPALPLPAKFKIRFLEPVDARSLEELAWRDSALVRALTQDIRALMQENLFEMVAERRSVWLG